MLKRASAILLILYSFGVSGCMQFSSIDKTDAPRYAEVLGRVYRLKSDFRVYGHVMYRGRGPTAYSHAMYPVEGPNFGNRHSLVWGIVPKGTLIRLVGVKQQPPDFTISYMAEIIGPKDERFEGIRIAVEAGVSPSVYVGSATIGGVKQLKERWFEEVFEVD